MELIDTFLNYQESIKRCMCIVHDPQRAAQGGLGLTAIKLADSFVDQHRAGNGVLTFDKLKAASISYKDIFEEIPIRVRNSALARALISTIQPEAAVSRAAGERLAIGAGSQLERNLTFLNDSLDDVVGEQQKVGPTCMSLLSAAPASGQKLGVHAHLHTYSRAVPWLLMMLCP